MVINMTDAYDWVKPKKEPLPEFFNLKPTYFEKEVIDHAKVAPYKVEVKVINVLGRGQCAYGNEPGDTFIFDGDDMKVVKSHAWGGDLCTAAVGDILPEVRMYMWGAYLPWARGDRDNKTGIAYCRDLKSLIVFQLRRIKKPESPYFKREKEGE
jgi:uncharacterized repeat protein (TIGR04076 family)